MSGAVLRGRLQLLDELRQIVSAMRNLAYAEKQRLGHSRDARDRAMACVLRAIADVLPPECRGLPPGRRSVWVVIGTERGFCGGFNDRLAEALPERMSADPNSTWLVAGGRLRQRVAELLPDAVALRGCGGTDEIAPCINAWLDTLAQVESQPQANPVALWVLHNAENGVTQRRLLPLPDLPAPTPGPGPLRHLPLANLMPNLLAEAVHVGLLAALHESLQVENAWRLAQMQRAQDYLDDTGNSLRRRYFRERQTDITSELETLMSALDLKRKQGFGSSPAEAAVHQLRGT